MMIDRNLRMNHLGKESKKNKKKQKGFRNNKGKVWLWSAETG